MRKATLCILTRSRGSDKEILLAMKKRGFGVGKWNGVGGKVDAEKGDKGVIDAVVREAKEEIGVEIENPEEIARLSFYFPYKEEWNQQVHVFSVKNWQGDPAESEEMMPRWFDQNSLPYESMWDDDKYWLPRVLEGKKIRASFTFKEGEIINKKEIKIVEEL
jgi:8-oxo-dGTP pyrophosphatase MutT (NUDIX family)